jgi:hypothetical protein
LVSLCRLLEQWRADCNSESAADPDDFPNPNWRAAGLSLIFFVLGQIVILEQSWLNHAPGSFPPARYFVLLAVCGITCLVFMFHTVGLFERRFWRALSLTFRGKSNCPFTPLIRNIATDLAAAKKLSSFSDEIVVAARERLGVQESELRDRIAILLGQPSLTASAGLLAGAWATWKGFHNGDGTMPILLCGLSITLCLLSMDGFRLRIALVELTRCQAMLSLEIARRKIESKDSRVSEFLPPAQKTPTSPGQASGAPS